MFNLLVDDTNDDSVGSVTELSVYCAEKEMDKVIAELEVAIKRDEQFTELAQLGKELTGAKAEDTSLLSSAKPALENIGIDCESNVIAAEGITEILQKYEVVPSEEGFIADVLGWGVFGIFWPFLRAGASTAEWLRKVEKKLVRKTLAAHPDAGDYENPSVEIVTAKQFSDLIGTYTKCLEQFTADVGAKTTADVIFENIKKTAKSGMGIDLVETGSHEDTDKYDPKKQTPKSAGWDLKTVESSIKMVTALTKVLGRYVTLEKTFIKMKKAKSNKADAADKEEAKAKLAAHKQNAKATVKFFQYALADIKEYVTELKFIVSMY